MKSTLLVCATVLTLTLTTNAFSQGICHTLKEGTTLGDYPATLGNITEFPLNWTGEIQHSTHELVITPKYVYVTGQNMAQVARFDHSGKLLDHFKMDSASGPHGILLDRKGRVWVSLEFEGTVVRLDDKGQIVKKIDVQMYLNGSKKPINTAPHGICLGADGETIWFTGKRTNTVGRIVNPDAEKPLVEHFELPQLGAVPIFLCAGPDGSVWGTELLGSKILKVSKDGEVQEFTIPSTNSRPIGIIPDPEGKCMWFSEESGVKIGKITFDGVITEYPVPALQKNDIVASLAFDSEMNLWVQAYVDIYNPTPTGHDYIVKFDKSIRDLPGDDISGVPFSTHAIPSRNSVMHRIELGPDGNLWFTELMMDKLGKVTLK